MEKEDKDLLLKDLCARLPYNLLISINGERYRMEKICNALIGINTYKSTVNDYDIEYWNIKPYLFPLSSMTEEQGKELEEIDPEFYSLICENGDMYVSMDLRGYDWLNKNHFDYRGLIPMGLAIDATNLNIY